MSAVMGPSGAGKTSFLNALRGTAAAYGTITGSVSLNGKPQPNGLMKAKDIVGFVPQDDCVHEVRLFSTSHAYSVLLKHLMKLFAYAVSDRP